METGTVLEIIAMLDQRASLYWKMANKYESEMVQGQYYACREFSDYLQDYIESKLNAAEIQIGE